MIKTSRARILKRQTSALARRQVNLGFYQKEIHNLPSEDQKKVFTRKIESAKADIDNLQKKGIRYK